MSSRSKAFACLLLAPVVHAQTATRVDVDSAGRPAASGPTFANSALSADGRFVAFTSDATNLSANDANGTASDVFLHDRATGVTELVSVGTSGAQADAPSQIRSLSPDARFVVFSSTASNLVSGANGKSQVYLRDRVLGTTELISVSSNGTIGSDASFQGSVSGDGRWVAFASLSQFLDPVVPGGRHEVYLRDRTLGTTVCVSKSAAGTPSNGVSVVGSAPSFLSSDGRWIAFASAANDLGPTDQNDFYDVYVHDTLTGARVLVSVDALGGPPNNASFEPALSADGRYVVFESVASNLVANDTNGEGDVFVRDLSTGATVLVSVATGGAQALDFSHRAHISSAGDVVAFLTAWPFDALLDQNTEPDLYLRDLTSGTTTLASAHGASWPSSPGVVSHSLSGDGRVAGFSGRIWGVTPGDAVTPWTRQYVFDRDVDAPAASYCTAKPNSAGCVPVMSRAGFASLAGYDAHFLVATKVLNQKFGVLLWGTQANAVPFGGGTLCVKAPLKRTPSQPSGGSASGSDCTGTYSFHWSQAYMNAEGVQAGQTYFAQWWHRDSGFPAPNNIGLTAAVWFVVTQ